MTDAEARRLLETILRDPMAFVVKGLQSCDDSSLHISTQVNVSASTIRTLRSGNHTGNLRVDVWAELVHWLLLPAGEVETEES